jgi:hypothetical protein
MRAVRVVTGLIVSLVIVACPLPFQYTPQDGDGSVTASNDPANPSITAAPSLVIEEQTSGASVGSESATVVARANVAIGFLSETPGATYFYTSDGSRPVPGSGTTTRYSSTSPIELDSDGASATIKVIAIGPSMYPSQVTERTVQVDYPVAGAPVFSPAPGVYSSDQTVTLSSSTPGATIYYSTVAGTGPAPTPVPGQPGTQVYTGPITIAGAWTSTSISAIAVRSEAKDSSVSSGVYSIGFTGVAADPVFSLDNGFQAIGSSLVISSASDGAVVYYTYTTDDSIPADPVPGAAGTAIADAPITLTAAGTSWYRTYRFKAIADNGGYLPSEIVSGEFIVVPRILVTQLGDDYPQYGTPRTLREAVMAIAEPYAWWDNPSRPPWAGQAQTVLIEFDPGLNAGNPYTITLDPVLGAVALERSVAIVGMRGNPSHVTVSGGNQSRVIIAGQPDRPNQAIWLQHFTVADGVALGADGGTGVSNGSGAGGGAGAGGGIYVTGYPNLSLDGMILRNNTARGGDGGAPSDIVAGVWGAPGVSGGGGPDYTGSLTTGGAGGTAGGLSVAAGAGGDGGWFAGGGSGGSASDAPGTGGNGGFGGGGGGGGARRAGVTPGAVGGSGGTFGGNGGQEGSSGTAGGGGGAGLGGAIFVHYGTVAVQNTQFIDNTARGGSRAGNLYGGGVAAGHGEGHGGAVFVYTGQTLVDGGGNAFSGNVAADGGGSASGTDGFYEM